MQNHLAKFNLGIPIFKAFSKNSLYGLACLVAGASIATLTSVFTPATAFTFTQQQENGQTVTAGNPAQPLYNLGISHEDIGKSFSLDWFLAKDTKNTDGKSAPVDLSATGIFKVLDLTTTNLSLEIKITNNTQKPVTDPNFNAAILSMGFGVTPNPSAPKNTPALKLTQAGSVFTNIGEPQNQNFPGGFKDIDVCISATKNCSGGDVKDGLQLGGKSDTFKVNIGGNFGVNYASSKVTLSSLPLKFQTAAGSFELAGTKRPRKIPEPATPLALGLIAIGASFLKRKTIAA